MGGHTKLGSHSLDALSHRDKSHKISARVALVPIGPLIVCQNNVVEPEAILVHPEEPHAHRAWPHHQTNELREGR